MNIKYIKRVLCSLIAVLCISNLSAQKEAANWFFGYGCGLTWKSTRSVSATGLYNATSKVLTNLPNNINTSINTLEGCFTLSDGAGNLLFYSDGMNIWNRNNAIMANGTGLTGDPSSAQSGIIVPYPGNPNKYVAITLGATGANNLSYSIVDMTAQGGLGAVETSQKNIRFTNYTGTLGESVTAFKHTNNIDYWILATGKGGTTTTMNAWLLTSSGVSTTPVKSNIPFSVPPNTSNGYLKISPDGKYYAWPTFSNSTFIYGEFDANTGIVSNSKQITGYSAPYGVEFSSNNELVYLKSNGYLYVYKLSDLMSNINSPKTVPTTGTNTHGAIQLAPDGRIYIPINSTRDMLIIEDINDFNNFKVYRVNNFLSGSRAGLGLPSFAASFFNAEAEEKSFVCRGNSFNYKVEISFTGPVADFPVRLEWNWGDGSTIENQNLVSTQTTYSMPHSYTAPNTYTVTITPYKAGNIALTPITLDANVVDCKLQVNRQIRINVDNASTQLVKQ